MLTIDLMKQALPKALQKRATQDFVDEVNLAITDPFHAELLRENILGYTDVLKQGKYKLMDYVCAVKYVSYKNMNMTNGKAWAATFPDRYQRLVSAGATAKDISASVAAYNRNKLVNIIYDQSLIPVQLLNASTLQKAINVLSEKMLTSDSERIQVDAATSLILHLKPNETSKVELDIQVNENTQITELKQLTAQMAAHVVGQVNSGAMSARDAAHQQIFTVNEQGEEV